MFLLTIIVWQDNFQRCYKIIILSWKVWSFLVQRLQSYGSIKILKTLYFYGQSQPILNSMKMRVFYNLGYLWFPIQKYSNFYRYLAVLVLNGKKIVSSKNHTQFQARVQNIVTLFQTKMIKIYTLFQTKTAKKRYPLGPHIAYKLLGSTPQPPIPPNPGA